MDCPLCGAQEETVAHFVTECCDGAVWGDSGGCAGGNIAVQRENRREGGEVHCIVGRDVREEKKRNGLTNAGTCMSVVVVVVHIGP